MILFYKYIFWDTVYIYGLQTNGTKTLKCKNTYKYEAQFFQVSHSIYSLSTAVILGTCAAGSCDPLFFEMTVLTFMIMFVMMMVRMKMKMRMRMITMLTRFFLA